VKRFYLGLWAVSVLLGATGCAGDSISPARATDLNFFDHSGAVIFNGRVKVGVIAGLPDTRLLAWTAAGDDGMHGRASLYDVRYVRQKDLDRWGLGPAKGEAGLLEHWGDAHKLANEPVPGSSGSLAQVFLPRVFSAEDIWLAMRTLDETGQSSSTSNVVGPIRVSPIFLPLRSAAGATIANFGAVVHWAGDIDGNSYNDLLLGSPALGRVTIHRGGSTSKLTEHTTNPNGVKVKRALTELLPATDIIGAAADEFGFAVTGLGRVTTDRPMEFAIGAPGLDIGATTDAGAIYIFHGRKDLPEVLDADSAYTIVDGAAPGERLGSALSSASTIAGDSTLNFLAGAPGAGSGTVYVFRAGIKAPATVADAIVVVHGAAAGDELGAEVEVIGDVNGDGIPDIAIGAPGHDNGALADAGAVYVFYGGDAGILDFSGISGQRVIDLATDAADVTILGTVAGRRFGQSITVGGDLAGNGTIARDFAVGGTDTAFVFFGGDTGTTTPFPPNGTGVIYTDGMASALLTGPAGSGFGRVVIGAGDLNRDLVDDLAVAVPGLEEVQIFYGPITTGAAPDETISSPAAGIGFASGLAGPGDVNLDGFPDLLIAAPGAGQAYLSF